MSIRQETNPMLPGFGLYVVGGAAQMRITLKNMTQPNFETEGKHSVKNNHENSVLIGVRPEVPHPGPFLWRALFEEGWVWAQKAFCTAHTLLWPVRPPPMVPQQNHLLNDWPIFGLQLMINHIIGTKVPVQKVISCINVSIVDDIQTKDQKYWLLEADYPDHLSITFSICMDVEF